MSGGLRSPAQAHLNQLFHGSEELDDDLTSVWPPPDQGSTLSSPAGEPGPPGDQADAKQDRDPDDSTSAGERPLVDMSLGNVLSYLQDLGCTQETLEIVQARHLVAGMVKPAADHGKRRGARGSRAVPGTERPGRRRGGALAPGYQPQAVVDGEGPLAGRCHP